MMAPFAHRLPVCAMGAGFLCLASPAFADQNVMAADNGTVQFRTGEALLAGQHRQRLTARHGGGTLEGALAAAARLRTRLGEAANDGVAPAVAAPG